MWRGFFGRVIASILGDRDGRSVCEMTPPFHGSGRAGSRPRFKQKGRGSGGLTPRTTSATFSFDFPPLAPSTGLLLFSSLFLSLNRLGRSRRCGRGRRCFQVSRARRPFPFLRAEWGVCSRGRSRAQPRASGGRSLALLAGSRVSPVSICPLIITLKTPELKSVWARRH